MTGKFQHSVFQHSDPMNDNRAKRRSDVLPKSCRVSVDYFKKTLELFVRFLCLVADSCMLFERRATGIKVSNWFGCVSSLSD